LLMFSEKHPSTEKDRYAETAREARKRHVKEGTEHTEGELRKYCGTAKKAGKTTMCKESSGATKRKLTGESSRVEGEKRRAQVGGGNQNVKNLPWDGVAVLGHRKP